MRDSGREARLQATLEAVRAYCTPPIDADGYPVRIYAVEILELLDDGGLSDQQTGAGDDTATQDV